MNSVFLISRASQFASVSLRAVVVLSLLLACGCNSSKWIRARYRPDNPLNEPLQLRSWAGPQPTPRTEQWLRRHALIEMVDEDFGKLIDNAEEIAQQNRTAQNVYVLAELGYIAGKRAERRHQEDVAIDRYSQSVANAYFYLFDEDLKNRNPYDPQFRSACDLYNGALEASLRIAKKRGMLKMGSSQQVTTDSQSFDISFVSRGSWSDNDIADIEFVSDYEVEGLTNHYQTFGLGVPLIAIYSRNESSDPQAKYYAPGMSLPVTAFLRVHHQSQEDREGRACHHCNLEFYSPIDSSDIRIGNRLVPLQTDISTPLAFTLNDPQLQEANAPTRGMLDAERSSKVQGLYMLEPYDPYKIPVLMVHGLWSSATTWMEMFNDLRADPRIRDNYQFWFYLYPTGQPFWVSATQLREDLAEAKRVLDPKRRSATINQMVLVGHSMGGLLARMQTIESNHDFARLISNQPIEDMEISSSLRERLRDCLYFRPDPAIRRVVTIATPYRGSNLSNSATQWLGRRLFHLPKMIEHNVEDIVGKDSSVRRTGILRVRTSIESLATDSPVLPLLLNAETGPDTKYHNVIGRAAKEGVVARIAGDSDGVVKLESARLGNIESQIEVVADHTTIHQNPKTVLELQRILRVHLSETRAKSISRLPSVSRMGHREMPAKASR